MRTALDTTAPANEPPIAAAAPRPAPPKRKKKTLAEKNAELRRQLAELKNAPSGRPEPGAELRRPPQLHTDDIKIDQGKQTLNDGDDRHEIVQADQGMLDPEYSARIAFAEEPVTIEINAPSGDNPVTEYFCAVNGKGAEVWLGDRWVEVTWLPVSQRMTIKRKYIGVLAGSKITDVKTEIKDRNEDRPKNLTHKTTSATCNFTVIEDKNPRGAAWLSEVRRRHF